MSILSVLTEMQVTYNVSFVAVSLATLMLVMCLFAD